jgi:dolichyl-phosphate beta-glucosyltransferase
MYRFVAVQLFTRRTAKLLFRNLRLQRWCFDVELTHLALHFRVPIAEESVNWQEMPGSKITPLSALSMAWELFLMKSAYGFGWWVPYGEGMPMRS